LTAALVVRRGLPLYPDPQQGTVLSWFYGPVAAYAYAPATLGTSPIVMVLTARLLSLLYFFGPLIWLLAVGVRRSRLSPVAVTLSFLLFASIADGAASLRYTSTAVLADNPTMALGMVSLLVLGGGPSPPGARRLAWAILAATLAAWSKQIAAPLLPLIVAWCWWVGGWRLSLRALAMSAAMGLATAALFTLVFGPSNLFFGLVTVLKTYPYRVTGLAPITRAVLSALRLEALWIIGPIAFGVIMLRRRHEWPRGWSLWPLWSLFGLPLASLAYVKVGGDVNSLAFVTGPLLLAGAWLVARAVTAVPQSLWLLTGLALVLAYQQNERVQEEVRTQQPPAWLAEQRLVIGYLRSHPGEAYFPERPLEHLAVEGRFTHHEYGLMDRELAGFPLTHAHIWQGMPPDARRLIYPGGLTYAGYYARRALPEFDREVGDTELPGAVIYERE
jgi:hypothetical protein